MSINWKSTSALLGISLGIALLIGILIIVAITPKGNERVLIGHHGSPQLAFLYAASAQEGWDSTFALTRLGASADVGYALLAGSVSAGFIEPDRLLELMKLKGFDELEVAGKVTFPYGATLVTRSGSNARIADIQGLRLAVAPQSRRLVEAFTNDVKRFGVELSIADFETLSVDALIPALESGKVDAVLTKGSQALVAEQAGHSILYQVWDLQPGDACCPAVIDQLEYLLLVRKGLQQKGQLVERLHGASKLNPDSIRIALAQAVFLPRRLSEHLPLPAFEPSNNDLLATIGLHANHNHVNENPSKEQEKVKDHECHAGCKH